MKSSTIRTITLLIFTCLCIACITGCRHKPAEGANSAMSEKQKAIIAEHKQKQLDEQ